jgi:hypothetical protein
MSIVIVVVGLFEDRAVVAVDTFAVGATGPVG